MAHFILNRLWIILKQVFVLFNLFVEISLICRKRWIILLPPYQFRFDDKIRNTNSIHTKITSSKLLKTLFIFISNMISENIQHLKLLWRKKGPKEKYQLLFESVNIASGLIGSRAMTDGKVFWWTFSPFVVVSSYWLLTIFTIYYHVANNQFTKSLPSLCLFGISISVCVLCSNLLLSTIWVIHKVQQFIENIQSFLAYLPSLSSTTSYHLKSMATKINDMIYCDPKCLEVYGKLCSESIDNIWKIYGITLVAILASIACGLVGPVYVYVAYGQQSSLFELKIPFLKNDPYREFIVNGILQIIAGTFVLLGNIAIEGTMVLFVNSLNITTKISKHQLDEFSKKFVSAKASVSIQETRRRLSGILYQVQTIDRWLELKFE